MTAIDPWRILVTGSRDCNDEQERIVWRGLDLATLLFRRHLNHRRIVIVHGKCPNGGVDLVAHRWAEATDGAEPEPHAANWDLYGNAAGPIRNGEMVALGADVCVGFPAPGSRGTWDCVRKAADAGIEVRIFPLAAR